MSDGCGQVPEIRYVSLCTGTRANPFHQRRSARWFNNRHRDIRPSSCQPMFTVGSGDGQVRGNTLYPDSLYNWKKNLLFW